MLPPDSFVDNSPASASTNAGPAVESQHPVDITDGPLLQTTSKHAYQVIRTKLWRLRHEQGKKPGEGFLDDTERSTKRRKAAVVTPNLIRKFEAKKGNGVQVVVEVQGEDLNNRTEDATLAEVEISKPITNSAVETLTKLLDSSLLQIQSQSRTERSDDPDIGRSSPRSIPSPGSVTPAGVPVSARKIDIHETEVGSIESSPATVPSTILSRQLILKRTTTCEASVQTAEIGDGEEARFGIGGQDENENYKENEYSRRRQASEGSLTSIMSMTSSATEVIWIGSVSGPLQNWDKRKKESTSEARAKRSDRNRRASSITVDWENTKQEVGDFNRGRQGVDMVHEIVIATVYDSKPTIEAEDMAFTTDSAAQELSIPDKLLLPATAASPEEFYRELREGERGDIGVALSSDRAMPVLSRLNTCFSSQHGVLSGQIEEHVQEGLVQERVLEVVEEEQEDEDEVSPTQEQFVLSHSPPPQVDLKLSPDISNFDLNFDFGLPDTPSSPTTINFSPSSSRPQSRQSRPSSRHRHYSHSCSMAPPPVPPRSPHRKSMPSMNANFHRSNQSKLNQILHFGENFLNKTVETDSGNEAIWERRREEVMEPLVGSPIPLPGCLKGGSLCGEGVVGSWVSSSGSWGLGTPRSGVKRLSRVGTI